MFTYLYFVQNNQGVFLFLVTVIGVIIGSFLNVLIYRWPIVIESLYRAEYYKMLNVSDPEKDPIANINSNYSFCPICKHKLFWIYNVPIFSFILLRGKCAYCKQAISWQYPIIESISGILAFVIANRFGCSWQTLSLLFFMWALLVASAIDCKKLFIPDQLVTFILFTGLLVSCFRIFINAEQAIYGMIVGYLFLFLTGKIFKLFTQIDGLGEGDFMLLAAIGSWNGLDNIFCVILMAAMIGLIYGLIFLKITKQDYRTPIPFGPFLSISGFVMVVYKVRIGEYLMNLVDML